jgi:hypothetical protein
MCFIVLGASEASKPAASSSAQARGPLTVTLPHAEVTGVTSTRWRTYSHCSHSSKASATRSTPPEVVLTQKRSGARRATMPSSNTTPFSLIRMP